MPLQFLAIPALLKVGAALVTALGVGAAVKGAVDMKKAHDTLKEAEDRTDAILEEFEENTVETEDAMEYLGKVRAIVASDFDRFVDAFEQIENLPEFTSDDFEPDAPKFDFEQIKSLNYAAEEILMATEGGNTEGNILQTTAAMGLISAATAIGSGACGAAVTALSSTVLAKTSLTSVGGLMLSAGGGKIVAGTALGTVSLAAGILVGGVAFALLGSKHKGNAKELFQEMLESEEDAQERIEQLIDLRETAKELSSAIDKGYDAYNTNVVELAQLVDSEKDWNAYSDADQDYVKANMVIVAALYEAINMPLMIPNELAAA